NYIVKIDEHVYIHELSADSRRLVGRADIAVTSPPQPQVPQRAGAAAVLPAPIQVLLPAIDLESFSFIEIRDRQTRHLVTAIELLSPSNKEPGPNRDQYLAKRALILGSGAHFVEIDLLRGGSRLPIEELPHCDYYIMVSRAEN